jgi:hypothetical protein
VVAQGVRTKAQEGPRAVRSWTSIDMTAGAYGYDLPYFARMVNSVDCSQVM